MTSSPDVISIPSSDNGALLTITLTSNHPVLHLSHQNRSVLTGHIAGLPCLKTHQFFHTVRDETHIITLTPESQVSITPTPLSSFDFNITSSKNVEACFILQPHHWFGLGHLMWQHWPLETASIELGPFYPFDNGPNGICTLLDPTFISTSGAIIKADDTSPSFHLSLNATISAHRQKSPLLWGTGVANFDRKILPSKASMHADGLLTFQSRTAYDWPQVRHPWLVEHSKPIKLPALRFSLQATTNVRTACDAVLRGVKRDLCVENLPSPPCDMMRYPIWSTWARYKDAVTQSDVIRFAQDIFCHDLPHSIMGIDDRWSSKYGDLEFDHKKFPNPKAMIDQLHAMGFLVTVWVTPFANIDSRAVQGEHRKYFVHTKDGELGKFEWWQPTLIAALDVTQQDACDWFVAGLTRLRDMYGLDGFKFDAGEPSFLPKNSTLQTTMLSPSEYTRLWIRNVASKFQVSEVRSGVQRCQGSAPMFRLFDRFSTWGLQNGLASVLPALLTSGVLGFPFSIPDYIAGNAYGDEVPNGELMVRWAQASSAMPAMQFSIPPWTFGDDCERLCRNALKWRETFFWRKIEACVEDAWNQLVPICRPMWWAEPKKKEVASLCDQFMVGNDVVVAPVVVCEQRERRVFLPNGRWKRVDLEIGIGVGDIIEGNRWVESASATLDEMPTFLREI